MKAACFAKEIPHRGYAIAGKLFFMIASIMAATNVSYSANSNTVHVERPLVQTYPVYPVPQVIAMTEKEWALKHHALHGEFSFPIKTVRLGEGKNEGYIYLDSAADFRSPASLNVILLPKAAAQMKARIGEEGVRALLDSTLTVHAVARHVKITCAAGCPQDPSSNYYFQTQAWIGDISQIIAPELHEK